MKRRQRQFAIEALENRLNLAGFIAVGTDSGTLNTVRIYMDTNANGTYEKRVAEFHPFADSTAGVRVALGDFDGDTNYELVTATGSGPTARVIVWDLTSSGQPGSALDDFSPFSGFKGGLFVAAGDLNGDAIDELVVSESKGASMVKIFSDVDRDGLVSDLVTNTFDPFSNFAGGTRIALGNTNNAGGEELIVARGPGSTPRVMVYTDANADRRVSNEPKLESFLAYESSFRGGVFVASGGFENAGSNGAEIVVGPGAGRAPLVKLFTDSNSNGTVSDNAIFDSYNAYATSFTGGVRVAAGDTDNSGSFSEAVTVPGSGLSAHLVIRDDNADALSLISDNPAIQDRVAFSSTKGSFVAFGKVLTETFAHTGFPQNIPDGSTLNTSIFVPASAGKITDLDINLDIFHSFDGDLDVTLTHVASGISLVLFQDVGGSNEGFFIRLNDESGTDISTASNPKPDGAINGIFNPGGTALLSVFDGLDASGEWRLSITDDSASDTGTLFNWSMVVSY